MVASLLLESKLYIPQRHQGQKVARQRLVDRLNQSSAGKLALISAPAGFGKTTVLTEWVAATVQGRNNIAWVSLDQNDNDRVSFWRYIVEALRRIQPEVGDQAWSLLNSPQPPEPETLITVLVNEINTLDTNITLILDDYHAIANDSIHRAIAFLIDHLPPQMHLVIASRSDPPLPLARLRVRGELTELRAADLRFTPDEAIAFLNQMMGLDLAVADVAALEQRTEGWIAGLQLAALSLQGRTDVSEFITAFSGDNRYVVDYLVEEVLQRQPDNLRKFLLQTSILTRLNSALCQAVTEQHQGPKTLEALERSNLFVVPLDDQRQWYRYHHLFADVLQTHLHAEQPDLIPTLHQRASEWYEQNDLPAEAIHHGIAAQDFERAATLIEQVWPTMRKRQQEATVLNWMTALPDSLIRDRPILSVVYALILLNAGKLETVEARLQDAERRLAQLGQTIADSPTAQAAQQYQSLPASIANARAYRAQALGDFSSTITYSQQALALLPTDDYERGTTAAILGLAYWASGNVEAAHQSFAEGLRVFHAIGGIQITISATFILANMGMAQGHLRATIETCEQALRLAAQHRPPLLLGTAELHLALSEIRYEQGELDAANQLLSKGESLRKQALISGADSLWWRVKAQLTAAQGDMDTALKQLHEAARVYRRSPVPDVRPIEALKVRWWLQQGRLAEALDWVRDCRLSVDDPASYLHEYKHLTLARVAIAQYKRDGTDAVISPVISLLNRLLAAAEAQDRTGSRIKVLVVLALASEAQNNIAAARGALERALALAEPEGYVRLFVNEGEPMRALLGQVAAGNDYAQRLLAAFDKGKNRPVMAAPIEGGEYVEPLTPREIEVLRLIAAGMRNQEIADELFISLATVKRHIANTYGKLGVKHRMEAVVRANELNLMN